MRGERRALVVGYGHMGKIHARILGGLGFRVTTCDPTPEAGADWRRVEHIGFDAVCIATSLEHCAEAAAQWEGFDGHLLIEKPAALSSDELVSLRGCLEGQHVAVGYVERFNPVARRLLGALSYLQPATKATFCRFNDRMPTHPTLDLASHDVDLARFLGLEFDVCRFRNGPDHAKWRQITIETPGVELRGDLMRHTASPVALQWEDFLEDAAYVATLDDALAVLEALEPQAVMA